MTAAELMKDAANASQYDAMRTELEGIDADTNALLDIAGKLEGRGAHRHKEAIIAAVDRIWDSAQLLFLTADYDKAPGSIREKPRTAS